MTSHLGLMVLFAVLVSAVFAILMRDEPMDQVALGARLIVGFVGAGVLIGWVLYPLPF